MESTLMEDIEKIRRAKRLMALIPGGGFLLAVLAFFGLIFIVAAVMSFGVDYAIPTTSSDLLNSEIMFIFDDQFSSDYRVLDYQEAFFNNGKRETYVPGMQIDMYDDYIVSPIDGEIHIEYGESNSGNRYRMHTWIEGNNIRIYLNDVDLIVDDFDVKKGDIIGYVDGVLDVGMQVRVYDGWSGWTWEWVDYYPQYFYWKTRHNVFPLLAPPELVEYTYTSGFGHRQNPKSGEFEHHNGQDIAAEMNTPLFAVEDGVIERLVPYAVDYSTAGNRIYLLSTDGERRYAYFHLSQFFVQEGQEVKKGEIIASIGSTGRSTGPHLHFEFEVVRAREVIDPLPAIKLWESNMDWETYLDEEKMKEYLEVYHADR